MVISCSAYKCRERYRKNSSVTLHSFPKDPERKLKWIAALRIDSNILKPHSKVCSNHFTHDSFDWEKFGGKWLKPNAVPTIFTHLPVKSEKISASTLSSSRVIHELGDSEQSSSMTDESMLTFDEQSTCQDWKENTPPPERLSDKEYFTSSPSDDSKSWSVAQATIQRQSKIIHLLQKQNCQLQRKIDLLTETINELRNKDNSNENYLRNHLSNAVDGTTFESSAIDDNSLWEEDSFNYENEEQDVSDITGNSSDENNAGPSLETVYNPIIVKISIL